MESGNGGASSKGVFLVPVAETSDVFQNSILAPLKSAYLYEESKQSFKYKSAVLVNNPALEEKYCAFRAKRRKEGYSEDELKESYGFLLFDDINKANALGETGVLTGNSTCTTLGDPSNGIYVSMYSDCLDLNRWYHGKSGYIAIIRLTKGRVKKVLENYTQNFTAPTVGFDCHVSEQLPSVSAKTSSFLSFERTQYYMYELLNDGSNVTSQSPSAAYPFAIVSFSYSDTKATLETPQEKSEEKKIDCHYFPWRGQLQIGTHFLDVGLRTRSGALIPAELPPVVKIDRAISILDLRKLLPKAVFETCFSGEVFLDGLYCSLYELVSSEAVETHSLSLLLLEIKEKDLALTIQLIDGGFLFLLHPSHFLTYNDTEPGAADVLQGVFVFPDSQVVQRETKCGHRKTAMLSEILRVLPVLTYAEGEVEKRAFEPDEELCEVLVQHMQSYAALITPGLASSPSREVSHFPDQYDVPDAHKHLYSSPEWTNRAWQSLRSYLSKPVSFQLPLSKASDILGAGQEERVEDLVDDVYICLSSPEEAPANPVSMEAEHLLTNIETPIDCCIASAEAQVDITAVPQTVVPDLQVGDVTKDVDKSDLTVPIKTDDMGAKNVLTTPDDLPAELIVSITSAERAVSGESLSMISTVSATKHNDFQLPSFSTEKLQTTGVNSLNDETVLDCPEVTSVKKTKRRKLCKGRSKGWKTVSKDCADADGLMILQVQDNLNNQKEDQAKESSGHPLLCNPSNIYERKVRRRKCKFRKLSLKGAKLRPASVQLAVQEDKKSGRWHNLESNILMDHVLCPLRKKTERWDLKPVISECGKILVPHGSVGIADQVKSLKDKLQSTKIEQCPEKMLVGNPVHGHDTLTTENIVVGDVDTGQILRLSDDECGLLTLNQERSEHSSKTDGSTTLCSEKVKGHVDTLSPEKIAAKGAFLLSKLKSVLLRGRRKTDILVSEETVGTAQEAETFLKKGRVDSHTGKLKRNYAITSVQDTVGVKDVSKMLSVDPLFAYALGLTPKETPDKTLNSQCQNTQQRTDLSETQEQTISEKLPEIIQRPPSIFPKRGRIKTLKKHQGISAEYVKRKWWLHFQTPASYASEKLKYKECTRDNSVRKTVKEKVNSSCSSTDALNLLADLALSASNDQVPPQPDPALGRKPETRLKKCDLTKDVTSPEQESVLHALLRQPVARPMQPPESPSHLVGGTELVGLVSKEHAYSLPPSSSLLLGLPGTPFQVSPLSGSTRLLHHHQTMYDNGINALHPSVGQKDRCELTHRTPDDLKKQMRYRRKFRKSRTFVDKDGSIQITRQWKGNYDFNLDSKFTSDSKAKTIIRALHGPWDFSMQDTIEEVRLIVHMWIGLFYSRSTARLFHVDSDPCSEERETPSEMVSAQWDLKVNSFVPCPSVTDTADPSISKTLDLSEKDNFMKDQESLVLDLSLRNSNAEVVPSDPQVNRKDTSVSSDQKEAREALNMLWSSLDLQKPITNQCYKKMVQTTEIIDKADDVRSTSENEKRCTPSQKTWSPEHIDLPSYKAVGAFLFAQERMKSVSIQPENNRRASGTVHMLHGCSNEIKEMKENTENSEVTEITLLHKRERDSSKSVSDEEVDSNKEAGDLVHALEQHEMESKDGENLQMKLKPNQEGSVEPSPKAIHPNDDSTDKKCMAYSENLLENEEQVPTEEPTVVSPGKAENMNDSVDGYTVHKVMCDGDHFGKEDGLDEKDNCVLPVEADLSVLGNQPVPMMCDGPESIKKDHNTESIPEPPLDEQPHRADTKEDTSDGWQFRKLCANSSGLIEEHTISERCPENPVCLTEKAQYLKAALSMSDKSSCSLDGTCMTNDSVKIGSQKKVMASPNVNSEYHDDLDIKPMDGEQKADSTAEKETFHYCEAEVTLTREADLKQANKTNRALENIHNAVVIPFIGLDISGEDTVQPEDSPCKVEVQCQEEIPFISETICPETVLPAGIGSASQMYSQGEELSSKIPLSLTDVSESNQPLVLGSESDERCSTPTMDEKPYDTWSQIETACVKHSPDQTPNPRNKDIPMYLSPNHTSPDKKMRNTTPAVVSASTSQELHTESTGHFVISPFKSKLEEVLGVKLQLQRTYSSVYRHYFERADKLQESSIGQDYCHPDTFFPSTESLQAITPNIDKDRLTTTSQTDLSQEPLSYSQRPVMAVKPSKNDESHTDYMSKDNAVMSHNIPVVTHTMPTTMFLKKKTESCRRYSEGLNDDKQDANRGWFSHVSDTKSKFHPDPLYQHQGRGVSKFNKIPSTSLSVQSFESAKKPCKLMEGNQDFVSHSLVEKVGQTKEIIEMDQRDCQDASASNFRRPWSSLRCTVYNSNRKRPYTFLEQVSQRCVQYDLTEASMDQECLIFSEQMKQLLKRSKRGPIRQNDTHDKVRSFCASPLTVHFCSLEETEDSVDLLNTHLDASKLFGQKIKVDMSDRKYTTEEENTLPPQKSGNPVEHAGVSGVTSECARLYEAMMKDICAVRMIPSRPKHFRMDRRKTEPRNHFDFCGQMKREMDESFCSNLNSVMKKSCKTNYRFYILITSDDAVFEETKVLLEAEGHTAVQSSKFFHGEDQSSTLLIILRNEDIAEHVCEIPHLLELKKSPVVQFAGIDEPDDVLNLTHQELFTKGGFIMFDGAVLEPLSICNIKKVSKLLQELSRTGTWKWMLHYRDSRQLKEHARLTTEAKEKKHFINWCQEAGILEVLPYHDCDLVSRDRPDYLACLVRLQVQNISARCPVFITDETTDSTFGKNGILTMTFNSFLTYSPI